MPRPPDTMPGLTGFAGSGELAALATAVCWTFTPILFGASGRLVGSRVVNRTRLLLASFVLLAVHCLAHGSPLPLDAEGYRWRWLAASGVIGLALGDAALFQAFVLVGPRLSMLMMSLAPVLAALFGWFLFGESLGRAELLGVVLTLGGIGAVVTDGRPFGYWPADTARRGLVLAAVGALGQAANITAARFGLQGDFSPLSATTIRITVAALVVWSIAARQRELRSTILAWRDRRALAGIAAGTAVGPVLGISLSMLAVQRAPLGVASTLMALPPVLLIPIEFALHGHRVSGWAVAGTLTAFAGVAAIVLS